MSLRHLRVSNRHVPVRAIVHDPPALRARAAVATRSILACALLTACCMRSKHRQWGSRSSGTLAIASAGSALFHLATLVALAAGPVHDAPSLPDAEADALVVTGVRAVVDPRASRSLGPDLARFATGPRSARRPPELRRRPVPPPAPPSPRPRSLATLRHDDTALPPARPSAAMAIAPLPRAPYGPIDRTAPPPATRAPVPATTYIPASVAQSLRLDDPYPDLPDDLREARPLTAVAEICVSDRGAVHRITIDPACPPRLAQLLTGSIRTWRYRPLLVQSQPRPFCHAMQITYL
jgi:hypothetical protein